MQKFDAVVVGAGNSGLTAACQLALAGKKTLLVEQHNVPGGCATSFVRGRFEFDPSIHEMCDYGSKENPGTVRNLMKSLGLEFDMVEVKDCFRLITTGSDGKPLDVTMPTGRENFLEAMEKYVPGSRQRMLDFYALLDEMKDGIDYLNSTGGKPETAVLIEKYPNLLRTGAYSVDKVFAALKLPRKCRDILNTYWSYLGVDTSRLSFIHYALMVEKYINLGAWIPHHTSHDLSVALEKRFRELGGTVRYNCRAEDFLFDEDRVCGVRTSTGIVVECDYVVANVNPEFVYGKMMPKDKVPERQKKLISARNRNFTGRLFAVYLGLDCTYQELGIKDYSIFMLGSADSKKEYKSIQKNETNQFSIFLCYNVANPDFSPEGTCVCSFTTFQSAEDWNDLNPEEYTARKNAVAKRMISQLKEKTGIDLSEHIEEITIASPLTFARFINSPEGTAYSYETQTWDSMFARMMSVSDDYPPVKGLITTGTSGPRGDGYNGTYSDGQTMASIALKHMGGN